MSTAFLGMRGTGDWANNQRPEDWRETILYLYPNGSAPLTAILSKLGSERTQDPKFHWWTKNLPSQAGAITGIFTDADLSTAYAATLSAGASVYLKMSADDAKEFRVGHQVLIREEANYNVDTTAEVTDRVINGANSYIAAELLEDADGSNDLDSADRVLIIGNVNAEGETMPDAISYDPVEYDNNTQIFRTPLEITRTARRTRLRTGDAYQEAKREALELHSIEMEKNFIWSVKSSGTGPNGKPKRTTNGILKFITANASDNVDDFVTNTDADFTGKTWLQGGEDWLDTQLEKIFRYGKTTKLALVGSGAMLGINQLAKVSGHINLEPMTIEYGIQVVRWLTPFGTILLKTHPLFSYENTNRNSIVIIEPEKLRFRFIDDTFFVEDPEDRRNRNHSRDGTEEEYITEGGLELHHPLAFGYLNGVGKDNSQ